MESLTVVAAVVTRCVSPLPLEGSLQKNKEDEKHRSTLGLHGVVS